MSLLGKLGVVFDRLHGSKLRWLLVFGAFAYMICLPPNLLSYKLFSALSQDLNPSLANRAFLRLAKSKKWSRFERFECLLEGSMSVELDPKTLRRFQKSLVGNESMRALGGLVLAFQRNGGVGFLVEPKLVDVLANLDSNLTPGHRVRLFLTLGLQGNWELADERLTSLIETLPSKSLKELAQSLKTFPSGAVFAAFMKRGQDQILGSVLEEKPFMVSKEQIGQRNPSEAIATYYKWRNYKSAADAGISHFHSLNQNDKIKVWKSATVSMNDASEQLRTEIEQLAQFSKSTQSLHTLASSDSTKIFREALLQNSNFQLSIREAKRSIAKYEMNRNDLRVMAYSDPETLRELLRGIMTGDPSRLNASQCAYVIEMAITLELERAVIETFTRQALYNCTLSSELVLKSSANLEFAELLDIVFHKRGLNLKQFLSNPNFAAVKTKNISDPDFQHFKALFLNFWISREEFGVSRFEVATISKREALLSKMLNSNPKEMSPLVHQTKFTNLHLNHIMASAIYNFNESEFDIAREKAEAVVEENPGWNLARSIVNMSSLRLDKKLISNFAYQVAHSLESEYLDNPAFAAANAIGLLDRSNSVLEKSILDLPNRNLISHSGSFEPNWREGEILIFEIWGVSDEIRSAQELVFLNDISKRVTVVCDPRLYGWFSNTFKQLRFVPHSRQHKDWRSPRAAENNTRSFLGRYLPESLVGKLHEYDAILPSSVLTNKRLVARDFPKDGPYMNSNPRPHPKDESAGTIRIGLVWRSSLSDGLREYLNLTLDEIMQLLGGVKGSVELHSIQHGLSKEEQVLLQTRAVIHNKEIDFYNGFQDVADYVSGMDLVIGVPTSGTEIASSVGVPVWIVGASPENYFVRTAGGQTRRDILSPNSEVIFPKGGWNQDRNGVLEDISEEIAERLNQSLNIGDSLLRIESMAKFPPPLAEIDNLQVIKVLKNQD